MSTIDPVKDLDSGSKVPLTGDDNIDPITFSVILNRFNTIAREMTLALEYTSWTSILALARDFSCAIYDAKARQVAMMDALPIHEETDVEFRSEIDGKMHACGHDCHTAMLLGAARLLKEHEGDIQGTVKLLFQPAEEGGAGGKLMREEGVLDLISR